MGLSGKLLKMGASDGPTNMAVDEALATLCRDQVILRFYEWVAPTLSLGYFQRVAEIDLAACRSSGVSLVRRPTGGRAVLHLGDLTYTLILPLHPPWAEMSVPESYRRINVCFQSALVALGLTASIGTPPAPSGYAGSPFCFAAMTRHDVVVGGRKVIGSAQRRFPAALLQQGSLLLDFDAAAILSLLGTRERRVTAASLCGVGSLREALGVCPDRGTVEAAIQNGFAREMGVQFVGGVLEPEELKLAGQLAGSRYASGDWTFRR